MWSCLIDLQPRTVSKGTGIRREDQIIKIAENLQKKTPKVFDIPLTKKLFVTRYSKDLPPTAIVLLQEIERWN
eukprot:UN25381